MDFEQLRQWVLDPARNLAELRTEAASLGLSSNGSLPQIRTRILSHIAQQADLTAQVPAATVPAGWVAPATPPAPAPAAGTPPNQGGAPAAAAAAQAAPATPGALVEPYPAPNGYHWEPRERHVLFFRRGYELVLVDNQPAPAPAAQQNGGNDMRFALWFLAFLGGVIVVVVLAVWAFIGIRDQIDDGGTTQVVYQCSDGREVASAALCSNGTGNGGTTATQQDQPKTVVEPSDTLAALQTRAVKLFGVEGQPSNDPGYWGPVPGVPKGTNGYLYQGPFSQFNVPKGARADFQGHSCGDKNSIGVYGPEKVEATTLTMWMVTGETACPPGSPGYKG